MTNDPDGAFVYADDAQVLIDTLQAQLTQATAWRRWTREKPTKPGWYWWRRPYGKREIVTMVQVTEWKYGNPGLKIYAAKDIERCKGEWAGPIPEGVEG